MTIFHLPDLGEGLPDAEIHEWHVNVGDTVATDDPLVSMETAKAVVEVPAPQAGTIAKLYGEVGEVIKTGAPLVEFTAAEAAKTSDKSTDDQGTVVGSIDASGKKLDEASSVAAASTSSQTQAKATPAVRALAKKLQVDISLVSPSGPNGLITSADVNAFHQSLNQAGSLELLKGVRKSMAVAMTKSHREVVPVTLTEDVFFSGKALPKDITISVILSIKAAVAKEPILNAWFDGLALGRRLLSDINLGIAMDTPDGLFVPVIPAIQNKTGEAIRETLNEYKQTVRDRTIDPKYLKDATFTLSNFGNFAGKYANPIVVPPTVAILGTGKIRPSTAVIEDEVTIGHLMPVSLTVDHRAVTGGEAARFLSHFVSAMADQVSS